MIGSSAAQFPAAALSVSEFRRFVELNAQPARCVEFAAGDFEPPEGGR